MIRAKGRREDGTNAVILVLEPGNLRRMLAGDPILIDLRLLLPDAMQAADGDPLALIIHACETDADFSAAVSAMSDRAVETGSTVHVIPQGSKEHM